MTNVKCTRCGVVNVLSNEICKACGLELSAPSPISPPAYPEPSPYRRRSTSTLIRPFNSMSDVFGPAVTIFSKNFWLITKLVLVIVTPFEIFKAVSVPAGTSDNWQLTVGTFALQMFCNALIAPALVYALMKVMQTGVAPGINESYRWALGKIGKLSLCAVMAWVLILLGFVALIIPGIILSLAFELVYPMAILENRSATEILKRSYNLTKGHRGKIFVATFCMSVLISFASAPITIGMTLVVLNGGIFWPVMAAAAIVTDVLGQGMTILSLVIYLSILRTLESRQSLIE